MGTYQHEDDTTDAKDILSSMDPEYKAIIVNVPKLLNVDFSPLLQPRLDYVEQTHTKKEQVRLMVACMVYYNLDFVMRCLGGEYIAKWGDVDAILAAIESCVSEDDKEHIRRILMKGCTEKNVWEEPAKNEKIFIRRGNNPSVKTHCDMVKETLNKEERNHHIISSPHWMCRGFPYVHHMPNTIIIR